MKRRNPNSEVRRSKSRVVRRSLVVNGDHTSVTLEEEFWIGLKEIAEQRRTMLSVLVGAIDIERAEHDHKICRQRFACSCSTSFAPSWRK
jgi:predicted DNA-binding ribbon-helix-helix protein